MANARLPSALIAFCGLRPLIFFHEGRRNPNVFVVTGKDRAAECLLISPNKNYN
jgi:hypothetical protein